MKISYKITICIVIVVISLSYFFSKQSSDLNIHEIVNSENQNNIVCHEYPNYVAMSRLRIAETGSDVLVKYKTNKNEKIPCNYIVEKNDFELKNKYSADYFLAIEDKFLIMDSGTAVNNRGLFIYDLSTQNEVFHDLYSYGRPIIKDNTVTYWINTQKPVTIENCPNLYNSGGAFLSQVSLDLGTLNKKDLGEEQCIYQE